MKHEEVVAALQKIAASGTASGIGKAELQELKSYTLIDITNPEEKNATCALTKKGRVMLKANTKSKG